MQAALLTCGCYMQQLSVSTRQPGRQVVGLSSSCLSSALM